MKLRTCVTVLGLVGLFAGCSGDEVQTVAPAEQGGRGEACQSRNDCREGLACVVNPLVGTGVCTQNEFPIAVDAQECFTIECTTHEDCCLDFTPSTSCADYQTQCATLTPPSNEIYCDMYNQNCVCSEVCIDEQCQEPDTTCTDDTECLIYGQVCVAGACVDCREDADCPTDQRCIANECETPCISNENCDFWEECQNGDCVHVGCRDHRECIFAYNNLLAECQGGECRVPCENDSECPSVFEVCDGGTCLFIGCQNDEQCRYLEIPQGGLPGTIQAVCRAPAADE